MALRLCLVTVMVCVTTVWADTLTHKSDGRRVVGRVAGEATVDGRRCHVVRTVKGAMMVLPADEWSVERGQAGAVVGKVPVAPEGGCVYRGKPRDREWFEIHYAEWRRLIASVDGTWVDLGMLNTRPTRMERGDSGSVVVQLHKLVDNRGSIVRLGRTTDPRKPGQVFDDRCQLLFYECDDDLVRRQWGARLAVVGSEDINGVTYPRAVAVRGESRGLSREEFRAALEDGYVLRKWTREIKKGNFMQRFYSVPKWTAKEVQ